MERMTEICYYLEIEVFLPRKMISDYNIHKVNEKDTIELSHQNGNTKK